MDYVPRVSFIIFPFGGPKGCKTGLTTHSISQQGIYICVAVSGCVGDRHDWHVTRAALAILPGAAIAPEGEIP